MILYNFNTQLPLFSVQHHHVWLTLNGTMGRWDDATLLTNCLSLVPSDCCHLWHLTLSFVAFDFVICGL